MSKLENAAREVMGMTELNEKDLNWIEAESRRHRPKWTWWALLGAMALIALTIAVFG